MADLDFLPSWYVSLQRRKRFLKLQAWVMTAAIVAGAGVLALQRQEIHVTQTSLLSLNGQLKDSALQQRLLDDQIALRKQLQTRKSVLSAIGQPVDASRLLTTLEGLMPKEMSLSSFSCTLDESAKSSSVVKLSTANDHQLERKLKVKIVGLAPSDMDLANFLAAMTNVSLFQNVIPNYSSPRTESGHVLREFEVSFWIDLTPTSGDLAWAN